MSIFYSVHTLFMAYLNFHFRLQGPEGIAEIISTFTFYEPLTGGCSEVGIGLFSCAATGQEENASNCTRGGLDLILVTIKSQKR